MIVIMMVMMINLIFASCLSNKSNRSLEINLILLTFYLITRFSVISAIEQK